MKKRIHKKRVCAKCGKVHMACYSTRDRNDRPQCPRCRMMERLGHKTIEASECLIAKMVAGNEKKFTVIIKDGDRMQWVGIGWVNEGPASEEDKKQFPHLLA